MNRPVTLWDAARDELLRDTWVREPRVLVKDIRASLNSVSTHLRPITYDNAVTHRAAHLKLDMKRVERRRRRGVSTYEGGGLGVRLSEYFEEAAARRAMTTLGLAEKLLRVVDRDRMVDAVLDDSHSIAPRPAARATA